MNTPNTDLPAKALSRFRTGFGVTFICIYILTFFDINHGGFLHACKVAFLPAFVVGLVLGGLAACKMSALQLLLCLLEGLG
jgi:hypothetical protein